MMDDTAPQPPIPAPLSTQMLDVGDGHSIYVETIGRSGGVPAVYLHGGPGSGCMPEHRRLFDPERFHAVLFDQRGAGRSTPRCSRVANTLPHLIADMELIRERLGIGRWIVSGGSWGATLALAYAQAHPGRVSGLILRATFLGSRSELDDAFLNALPRHYPSLYVDFLSLLDASERSNPLDAYFRRILDPDPAIHTPAARAWYLVESTMSVIRPSKARFSRQELGDVKSRLPSTPFMEAHYFIHNAFMDEMQLMRDASRLAHIPGIIIQGRYDMLCPPSRSAALAERWGNAEIRMVEGAGHSLYDPGVKQAVIDATNDMAKRLS